MEDIDKDIKEHTVSDGRMLKMQNFDAKKLVIISPARHQSLTARFKRDADAAFVDAKRAMTATVAKIPWWFVVMTVALGWNEFMVVLRSPLFFLTVALLGAGRLFLMIFNAM